MISLNCAGVASAPISFINLTMPVQPLRVWRICTARSTSWHTVQTLSNVSRPLPAGNSAAAADPKARAQITEIFDRIPHIRLLLRALLTRTPSSRSPRRQQDPRSAALAPRFDGPRNEPADTWIREGPVARAYSSSAFEADRFPKETNRTWIIQRRAWWSRK